MESSSVIGPDELNLLNRELKIMSDADAWKELLKACSENNTPLVNYHLTNGVDPNYQDPDNNAMTSPLFEAIHGGHWQCTQLLLEAGASLTNVMEGSSGNMTPLRVALNERQHLIVDSLLDRLPTRHKVGIIKTILVSGRTQKEVLQSLAATGHIVMIDNDDSVPGMVQNLQFATSNRKIRLANMVSTELVTVTDLIIREVGGVSLLEFLVDYYPLMEKLERILVLTTQRPPSAELSWLLLRNAKTIALVVPSWWDMLFDFGWLTRFQLTIWQLLTTLDHVQGTCYDYQHKGVATSADYNAPTERWDIKFKTLVTTTASVNSGTGN